MPDYFTEDSDRIPFGIRVSMFQQHLPKWAAVLLAVQLTVRYWLRGSEKARHGTLWEPDYQWQTKDEMPAEAQSRWAPWIEELEDLRFTVCGFRSSKTIGNKEEATCLLIDPSQTTLATLLWLRMGGREGIVQNTPSFTSWGQDETELVTMAVPEVQHQLAKILTPDYAELVCVSDKKPLKAVYKQHLGRSDVQGAVRFSVERILAQYKQLRVRYFHYATKSRVLRRLSPKEVTSLTGEP